MNPKPRSAASPASEKRCGGGKPNGAAVADGPVDEALESLTSVIRTRSAASRWSASAASIAAGPPPATSDVSRHRSCLDRTRATDAVPSGPRARPDCGFPAVGTAVVPDGAAARRARSVGRMPTNVLIAGGGPAALEAALRLHRVAGGRVTTTVLAPETEFTYRPLSVLDPFAAGGASAYPLERIAADAGFTHRRGHARERRRAPRHVATTGRASEIPYDVLLIAAGARPRSGRSRPRRCSPAPTATSRRCTGSSRTSRAATRAGWRSSCPTARAGRCRSTSSR